MAGGNIAFQDATHVISENRDGGEGLACDLADHQWEILGDLALRLHHKEEAKDAFQRCLDAKFSAKALLKLLDMYATEGDLQRTLNAAIRLTTYDHR